MGAAPTAYTLWQRVLTYDPDAPRWSNRDRFVLSSGHASMLLYSLSHLTGVKAADPSYEGADRPPVTLDDIRTFRQAGSRCPGHPEHGWTTGVEATTGPLGQGLAMSVGMAIASRWRAATYNRPAFDLFDCDVYALCGAGCMMEGVSSEAASLAAHLGLAKLCWIYGSNRITIEGSTSLAFTEDVASRFAGYEVRLAKRAYGWDPDARFLVPDEARAHLQAGIGRRGAAARTRWLERRVAYAQAFPPLAAQLDRLEAGGLPDGWDADLPLFPPDAKGVAGRDASSKVLNAVAERVPWFFGGSADLWPSTKTRLTFDAAGEFQAPAHDGSYAGRNLHYGVREHAMAAISNGLASRGFVPTRPAS